MKTLQTIAVASILLGNLVAKGADTNIDPNYLKIKIYGVWVSTSNLCTNLTEIFTNSAPEYQDVLSSPNFGSVDNATGALNGNYKCMVLKMSDSIKYAPNANSDTGNCVSGTEATTAVCQAGVVSKDENGNSITCTSGEDSVYLYLSTTSTSTGGDSGNNPFTPPTAESSATEGIKLSGEWVISGGATGTFVVNGTDKILDTGSTCDMQPPLFSFR